MGWKFHKGLIKMKKFIASIIVLGLTACGGSDGGDGATSNYNLDGIYVDEFGDVILLDASEGLISVEGSGIYYAERHEYAISQNTLRATDQWSSLGLDFSEEIVLTVNNNTSATVTYNYSQVDSTTGDVVYSDTESYPLERQSKSQSLTAMQNFVYSDIDPGTIWNIEESGQITAYVSYCNVATGQLTAKEFYYELDFEVSGCSLEYAEFEGSYGGYAYTATVDGADKLYIAALKDAEDAWFWDIVSK